MNIQKSVVFLYTNNKQWKKKLRKQMIYNSTKINNEIPGINITKEVKDLYTEKYKTLTKDLKEDTHTQVEKTAHVHGLENHVHPVKMSILPKVIYRCNAIC